MAATVTSIGWTTPNCSVTPWKRSREKAGIFQGAECRRSSARGRGRIFVTCSPNSHGAGAPTRLSLSDGGPCGRGSSSRRGARRSHCKKVDPRGSADYAAHRRAPGSQRGHRHRDGGDALGDSYSLPLTAVERRARPRHPARPIPEEREADLRRRAQSRERSQAVGQYARALDFPRPHTTPPGGAGLTRGRVRVIRELAPVDRRLHPHQSASAPARA